MHVEDGKVIVESGASDEESFAMRHCSCLPRLHALASRPLVPQVLHGFTKDGVVHKPVQLLLKVIGGLLLKLSIHPAGHHPWGLKVIGGLLIKLCSFLYRALHGLSKSLVAC